MSDQVIELRGCGSHSCAVSPPVGVGNNTSCRCMVSDYRGQSLVRSLQARIAELENEVRLQKSNAGGAYERIAELDAALDVCNQMILEVNHAQSNGSDWYTKGESGLYQQVSMWIRKASDAITKARGQGNE